MSSNECSVSGDLLGGGGNAGTKMSHPVNHSDLLLERCYLLDRFSLGTLIEDVDGDPVRDPFPVERVRDRFESLLIKGDRP
jgi:hypothetical protein